MKVIDTLDKSKAYRLKDLTLRQKTQIFEEVFGEDMEVNFLEIYLTGRHKNRPLWLEHTGHTWIVTARLWENSEDLSKYFKEYQIEYNSKVIFIL